MKCGVAYLIDYHNGWEVDSSRAVYVNTQPTAKLLHFVDRRVKSCVSLDANQHIRTAWFIRRPLFQGAGNLHLAQARRDWLLHGLRLHKPPHRFSRGLAGIMCFMLRVF